MTVIEAKAVVAMAVADEGGDVNGLSVKAGCIFPTLPSHSPSVLLLLFTHVLLLPFTPFILPILLPFEFWWVVEG